MGALELAYPLTVISRYGLSCLSALNESIDAEVPLFRFLPLPRNEKEIKMERMVESGKKTGFGGRRRNT
jgi:hypothetical protein